MESGGHFEIERLDATFGAVVTGLRLAQLDDAAFEALHATWLEHAGQSTLDVLETALVLAHNRVHVLLGGHDQIELVGVAHPISGPGSDR